MGRWSLVNYVHHAVYSLSAPQLQLYEETRRLVAVTRIDAPAASASTSRLSEVAATQRNAKWNRREKDDVAVLRMVQGVLHSIIDHGLTPEVAALIAQALHNVRHRESEIVQVVDTPGFNQPNLKELTTATLPQCFPEIRAQLGGGDGIAGPGPQCQFSNCRHLEEPGCVVHAEWERYPMYVQMNFEVEQHETAARRAGAGKQRRESRTKRKAGRSGRGARVEPKLELKKHRRVSRKRSKQGQLKDWETGGGRAWDEL